MVLTELVSRLLPKPKRTWIATIDVEGKPVKAVAFEENRHGFWHVSYERPGTYKEFATKWIYPTEAQKKARGW